MGVVPGAQKLCERDAFRRFEEIGLLGGVEDGGGAVLRFEICIAVEVHKRPGGVVVLIRGGVVCCRGGGL
jgi:hypothetical protein